MLAHKKMLLEEHELFQSIDGDTAEKLFALTRLKKFPIGSVLFTESSPVDGLYVLLDGLLAINRVSIDGEQQLIGILASGEVAGEMALFTDQKRCASAEAITDCQIAYIDRTVFFDFSDKYPEVYKALLSILARRLSDTNNAFAQNQFLPVSGRVAAVLLKLADNIGQVNPDRSVSILHPVSQKDMALMIGVARENVSRVVAKFRRDGVLGQDKGNYRINSIDRLREMAEI